MTENKMEEVAQLLGLELEEEFKIEGCSYKYKLSKEGLRFWTVPLQDWVLSNKIGELLTGESQIIKLPKSILTKEEKEYLSNIINHEYFVNTLLIFMGAKLWENKISIMKKSDAYFGGGSELISIEIESEKGPTHIDLPYFKAGTMYKGMEVNKKYSIEELGL